MKKQTILLLILVFTSAANTIAQENDFREYEESIIEQNKDVKHFDKIDIVGGGNLFISQSSTTNLKVVDQSSCLQSIKSEVKSNTLKIYRAGNSSNCRPDIHVGLPILKEIHQRGGGNITINEGFAPIDKFHYVLKGGGSVNMSSLEVESFYAIINGGGTMSIYANQLLEVDIKGGGSILYNGNPKVISNISGGGSVKQI